VREQRPVEKAPQVEKPAAAPRESAVLATRNDKADSENTAKPAKEKPAATEKNEPNPADKDQEKKPKN
jgi:hypothetical protein